MKKLVILSGGMDSTTVLAKELHEGHHCIAVHFQYGSKHNSKELLAVKEITKHYKVDLKVIELPFVNKLFKSDLLSSGGDIPEGHYADDNMKKTVIPFRNGIMLSITVGLAESLDCDSIVLGNHFGDHAVYPDCRKDFIDTFKQAALLGTYKQVTLESPFCLNTKADIAKLGVSLKVPYKLTWSCYKGGDIHCGKCGTCVERIEAFQGLSDNTTYKDVDFALNCLKNGVSV